MEIIHQTGNLKLLSRRKTAFLCSRRVPDGAYVTIREWTDALSAWEDCILCGNHSPMEQQVFTWLLRRRIPVILVLAETLPERWPAEVMDAFAEQRLLVVTHCDATVHRVSRQSAFDRNEMMFSMADDVVVGYAVEGGNIEAQVHNRSNVRYLMR